MERSLTGGLFFVLIILIFINLSPFVLRVLFGNKVSSSMDNKQCLEFTNTPLDMYKIKKYDKISNIAITNSIHYSYKEQAIVVNNYDHKFVSCSN